MAEFINIIRITDIDDESRCYNQSNPVSPAGILDEKYLVGDNSFSLKKRFNDSSFILLESFYKLALLGYTKFKHIQIVDDKTVVSRWTTKPRCMAYKDDTLLV